MPKYIIDIPEETMYLNAWKYENGKCVWIDSNAISDLTPYTEPDREAIENEVWDFVRKIVVEMECSERYDCFGDDNEAFIIGAYFYKEVKEKYENWKKSKDEIRVGDEVKDDGNIRAVVLDIIDEDYESYEVFTENGIVDEWQKGIVVKTGRHFDEVEKLLEEMRGE